MNCPDCSTPLDETNSRPCDLRDGRIHDEVACLTIQRDVAQATCASVLQSHANFIRLLRTNPVSVAIRMWGEQNGPEIVAAAGRAMLAKMREVEAGEHSESQRANRLAARVQDYVDRVLSLGKGIADAKRLLDWMLLNDSANVAPLGSGVRAEIRAVRDRLAALNCPTCEDGECQGAGHGGSQ